MKLAKLMMALFTVSIIIGLSSCSSTDSANPLSSGSEKSFDNSVFYSPDFSTYDDPYENNTSDAIITCFNGTEDRDNSQMKMGRDKVKGAFFPLGRIFKFLELTPEQETAVIELMKAKDDCTKALLLELRASERAIMEAAKVERDEIKAQIEAGTLTEEEGKIALANLRTETKAELEANPIRAEVIAKIKDCEDEFLAGVKDQLTEEQKLKWDDLIANLEKWRENRRKGHR